MASLKFLRSLLHCWQLQDAGYILFNRMWHQGNISQWLVLIFFWTTKWSRLVHESKTGPWWAVKWEARSFPSSLFMQLSFFLPSSSLGLIFCGPAAESRFTHSWVNPLHMTFPGCFHFNNSFLKVANCISQLIFGSQAWPLPSVQCTGNIWCVQVCALCAKEELVPPSRPLALLPGFKGIEWICLGIWRTHVSNVWIGSK